jgi:hypothetical protein
MRIMRFAFTALAATLLFASPVLAGGDWDYGDDAGYGEEDVGDGGEYGAYEQGPVEYYAGFYPPRWARPLYYRPRAILPYEVYDRGGFRSGYPGGQPNYFGDCEIKRKWRRGRYVEKIDCDD